MSSTVVVTEVPTMPRNAAKALELVTRQGDLGPVLDPEAAICLRSVNRVMYHNIPNPTTVNVARIECLPRPARTILLDGLCARGAPTIKELMRVAAKRKCFQVCYDLKTKYFSPESGDGSLDLEASMCAAAASGGHMDIVDSLRLWKCPWDESTCLAAAEGGHRNVLAHAISQGCPFGDDVLPAILESKSLASLVWYNQRGLVSARQGRYAVYLAAKVGSIEMLDYLMKEKFDFMDAVRGACRGGHVFVLKHLRTVDAPFFREDSMSALSAGHVAVLEWLSDYDLVLDEVAWTMAASSGSIPLLEWIRARGTPWDASAWVYACQAPDPTPVLDWMERHGYPTQ